MFYIWKRKRRAYCERRVGSIYYRKQNLTLYLLVGCSFDAENSKGKPRKYKEQILYDIEKSFSLQSHKNVTRYGIATWIERAALFERGIRDAA